jgi:hypothetical protein
MIPYPSMTTVLEDIMRKVKHNCRGKQSKKIRRWTKNVLVLLADLRTQPEESETIAENVFCTTQPLDMQYSNYLFDKYTAHVTPCSETQFSTIVFRHHMVLAHKSNDKYITIMSFNTPDFC